MSAPTQIRTTPRPRGGVGAKLPWWALALPTAAFVVLLALVLDPSEAHAATAQTPFVDFLAHLRQVLPF